MATTGMVGSSACVLVGAVDDVARVPSAIGPVLLLRMQGRLPRPGYRPVHELVITNYDRREAS